MHQLPSQWATLALQLLLQILLPKLYTLYGIIDLASFCVLIIAGCLLLFYNSSLVMFMTCPKTGTV